MGRNDWERQWTSVKILILFLSCLITPGRPKLDSCESERNCSIQLSNSTSLQYTVGHSNECDNIKLTQHLVVQEAQELYPYLATIAIYKKLYHDVNEYEFHVSAFNFSFIVPRTEISDNGILGVVAKFSEAPGYNNNSYYKEAICRFFNFSGSSVHLLNTFGAQEVPYSCIGINIYPSVFHFSLISIPSLHHLHYVVSWHQQPYNEYEYLYNFYEEQGDVVPKSVWVAQLIAVAVIQHQRLIHAVFQLPRTNAGVTFFKVSLVTGLQTIISKLAGPRETSVTFTDVPPGQYQVVVQPRGGICDTDLTLCAELASERVNITQDHDLAVESSTNDTIVVVISICAVVLILIIGTLGLLMTKKHYQSQELERREIYITSMASRELEKHVTSYFCSFLSVAFHTSVTFTFPLLQPGKLKIINAVESKTEVETKQNLLQSSHLETSYSCCIILQFSYSGGNSQAQDATGVPGDQLLNNSIYFKKHSFSVVDDTLRRFHSKKAYFVTFKHETVSSNTGIACTIYEGSLNSMNSEDQITVLNGAFRKSSLIDNISQKIGSLTPRLYNHNVKEYFLPCDIHDLFKDLRSCLQSKSEFALDSEISNNEYWHLAVTVFQKAAEHQPDQTTLSNSRWLGVDAGVHRQEVSETDFIHNNQNTYHHRLEYIGPPCSIPAFSASASQIQMCRSDSSLIVPLCAAEDLFNNSASSENKTFHEILQSDDPINKCKSPYNQTYMLLKSIPINGHGSVCSCDSYSNLTEAEKDIEQQYTVSQVRN